MLFTSSAVLALLAVGVRGRCGAPISVYTVVQVAGVNTALATCEKLSGQLIDPNSNAGRYGTYVTEQGAKSGPGQCASICTINLISNPETGANDLLGELKSACQNDGGTYGEKILGGGTKGSESAAWPRAVGVNGVQCGNPIEVFTVIKVGGVKAAFVSCDTLSGQLNEADSSASRYVEYLKEQSAKCDLDVCDGYCGVDLTGNLENDLLSGLKSACQNDGGTYSEKLA